MDIEKNNIRKLDHGLLLVFVELMHQRKTTRVAERLCISQSAVSHSLARLRELFDDALFLRLSDGLQPTPRALELKPLIEEILQKSQALFSHGQSFVPQTTERVFRIAANDLVASLYGVQLVEALRRLAPLARVTFRFGVGKEALEALRNDEVDIAVGRFYGLPAGFESQTLAEERFVLVARTGHPRLTEGIDLDTFVSLDHALVSFTGNFVGMIDQALSELGYARRVVASFPLYMSALSLVACSDVVATLPERLARLHADRFGLALYPLPLHVNPFPVIIVRHESRRTDPAINWLCDFLTRLRSANDLELTTPSGLQSELNKPGHAPA